MPPWAQAAQAMESRSGFLEVDGCSIHYIAWGDATRPPLLLVHGNAASAEWWRFIAPLLADDYHVIAPDLGGMGDSGHCGRYARERYAEQVLHVAGALAPRRAPLIVGHSLGGFVAIMAGTAHGERLAGVVVLDSPPREPEGASFRSYVSSRPVPKIYPDRESALLRFKVQPEQPVNCAFYLEHIARTAVRQEAGGWRWKFDPAALTHPRRLDYVQDLLHMRCPVALMWGEASARFDPATRAFCRATFDGVLPLVEIANARHHIMLDEPLALVAALRTQLSNWKAARPR
jgi:pimeloyl-ACP methyl ester carboxylesterase